VKLRSHPALGNGKGGVHFFNWIAEHPKLALNMISTYPSGIKHGNGKSTIHS
jgi:hypothetical protein